MKKLMVMMLFVLGTVSQSSANTVNFIISSLLPFGGRVYYACDSVEQQTEQLLQKLGANDITTQCSGGFNPWGFNTDAYVRAKFTAPNGNTLRTIRLQDWENCYLATEIFNGVRNQFQIKQVSNLPTCFRSNDSYDFSVTLLQ
jgi:hypothetical protein